MAPLVHRLRVRYNECDAQSYVFDANYFVYFDIALGELWREALGSYETLTADGLELVVAEAGARFRAPACFDDELVITLEVERLGSTSMVSTIGIARDGTRSPKAASFTSSYVLTVSVRRPRSRSTCGGY